MPALFCCENDMLPTPENIQPENRIPLTKSEVSDIVTKSLKDSMDALYQRIDSKVSPLERQLALHSDRLKLLEIALGAAAQDRNELREVVITNTNHINELLPQMERLAKSTDDAVGSYEKMFGRIQGDNETIRTRLNTQEERVNHAISREDEIMRQLNQMDAKLIIANAHMVATSETIADIQKDYKSIALFASDVRGISTRINGFMKSKKTWAALAPISAWVLERIGLVSDVSSLIESVQSLLGV